MKPANQLVTLLLAIAAVQSVHAYAIIKMGILPSIADGKYWLTELKNILGQKKHEYLKFLMSVTANSEIIEHNQVDLWDMYIKFPKEQEEKGWIEDPKLLKELAEMTVIVGEYRKSVYNFAKNKSIPYILTTPASIAVEEEIRNTKEDERVMFSAWPSWREFFKESIQTVLRARHVRRRLDPYTLGRVLILQAAPTPARIGVANELLAQLIAADSTSWVKLLTIRSDNDDAKASAKEIARSHPDVVIFLYEKADDIFFLRNVLRHQQDLGPEGAPSLNRETYIWDMSFTVSAKGLQLLTEDGSILADNYYLRLVSLDVNYPFNITCDQMKTDMTNNIGGFDATAVLLRNAVDMIPNSEYSRNALLVALQKTNRLLAGDYPTEYEKNKKYFEMEPKITGGVTFTDGFKYPFSVTVGVLLPHKHLTRNKEGTLVVSYIKCKPKREIMRQRFYNTTLGGPDYWELFGGATTKSSILYDDMLRKKLLKLPENKIQKIVVVLEEPFANFTGGYEGSGIDNRNFRGLTVELVDQVFTTMGRMKGRIIDYELYLAPDNHYGLFNSRTKTWSGAMGELQKGTAVMAIGMISKTKKRSKFFDYTPPFEFVGFTYLQKRKFFPPTYFNFMQPFEIKLWYSILATFFLGAIFIYILEYWNPFYDNIDDEHRFSWKEVFWYSFGTMSMAGGSFAPVIFPTRVFSIFYWFFALILTACYTGNLASFLTESYERPPDLTIEQLGSTSGLKWATVKGSYMDGVIRAEESNEFVRVANEMQYVENYTEGVHLVDSADDTVFIANNLLLQHYEANHDFCDLVLSPKLQYFTELAFPMIRGWEYKESFIDTMIKLRDEGKLRDITNRWLHHKLCEGEDDEHVMLGFDSFHGLYMVLGVFTVASFIILAIKLIALKLRDSHKGNTKRKDSGENVESSPMMIAEPGDKPPAPEIAEEKV